MGMELIERIRERAYQLWEAEGCEHGRDMEYWFRAEAQVAAEQTAEQSQALGHGSSMTPSVFQHAPATAPAAAPAGTSGAETKPKAAEAKEEAAAAKKATGRSRTAADEAKPATASKPSATRSTKAKKA